MRNGNDNGEGINKTGIIVLRIFPLEGENPHVRHFPVDKKEIYIGRAVENDIVIPDRLVSRRHCKILRKESGACWLMDLGSQNGTRLNGVLVSEQELKAGDVIQVGKTRISVDRAGESIPRGPLPEETITKPIIPGKERLMVLQEVNRALNSELDLSKLLGLIVDSALELTGGERGFLLLDSEEGLKCVIAKDEEGKEIPEKEIQYSKRIAEEVRTQGKPKLAADAMDDDDLRMIQSVMDLGVRSVLCVPLRVGNQVQGVIYVDHRLKISAFTEEDLDLLESLADQAGIAVRNAKLYKDLWEKKEELEAYAREVARLNDALEKRIAIQEKELLKAREELRSSVKEGYCGIIGRSEAIQNVFRMIDRYLDSDDPVLIQGESGTGKELVARALHKLGRRSDGPFLSENCAAIPVELLESELFGYMRGAFTGATRNKKGLFEAAEGGIIFLDEVGDMPMEIQKKLLRVLQDGEIRRLGSSKSINVDVRVIAATNRPLKRMVEEGKFREDLYYRLNVLPIEIPPLKSRKEDIPLLVEHFVKKFAYERKIPLPRLSPETMEILMNYDWPGNVRELENELKKALILSEGKEILPEHLSPHVRKEPERHRDLGFLGKTLPEKVERLYLREIKAALEQTRWNKSKAAKLLGISRFSLQRLMEKYGIKQQGSGQ